MTGTLVHYGIAGQKWGVRRYQNENGTLTEAGKKRYSTGEKLKETARKALNIQDRSTGWKQIEPASSGGGGSLSPLEKKLNVKNNTTNSRLTDENPDRKLVKALGGGSDIGNAIAKAKANVQTVLRMVGETAFKAAMGVKKTVEKGKKAAKDILDKIGNKLTKTLNIKNKTVITRGTDKPKTKDASNNKVKNSRLTDKNPDKDLIKKLSKKWPY